MVKGQNLNIAGGQDNNHLSLIFQSLKVYILKLSLPHTNHFACYFDKLLQFLFVRQGMKAKTRQTALSKNRFNKRVIKQVHSNFPEEIRYYWTFFTDSQYLPQSWLVPRFLDTLLYSLSQCWMYWWVWISESQSCLLFLIHLLTRKIN